MTRAERAEFVHRRLAELYPETPAPLNHKDTFTLLVAVLLSAQCTDARVNKVTPGLFALADTPHRMQEVSVEDQQEEVKTPSSPTVSFRPACHSVTRDMARMPNRSPLLRGFNRGLPSSIVKHIIEDKNAEFARRARIRIGLHPR